MKFFPRGALIAILVLGSTSLGIAHGVHGLLASKTDQTPQCPSVDQCGLSLTSLITP